jgi:hypothetical protein
VAGGGGGFSFRTALPVGSALPGLKRRDMTSQIGGSIKPIETVYGGYRFRSRLEARWAVFLDVLHARWVYEPEGYQLRTGPFLPDFWLPDSKLWLEIKPDGGECKHAQALFEEQGWPVAVGCGLPGERLSVWVCEIGHHGCSNMLEEDSSWCLNKAGNLAISVQRDHEHTFWTFCNGEEVGSVVPSGACVPPYYDRAVAAAKQARFEHGETPHR